MVLRPVRHRLSIAAVSLQALNLQAVDMQQLVLHMPGQDLSQLQLAGMPGMNMAHMGMGMGGGGNRANRDAIVSHIKEAVKLLMHASEELQVGGETGAAHKMLAVGLLTARTLTVLAAVS